MSAPRRIQRRRGGSDGDGPVRRDPRAETAADAPVPSAAAAGAGETPAASAPWEPPIRRIEQPACWILAVPDAERGTLSSHDRDVLGAARTLADAHGGAVVAVTFGPVPGLGGAGADRVLEVPAADEAAPGPAPWAPEFRAGLLATLVAQLAPRHVLLPDSAAGGADLGRRLAMRLGELPAPDVRQLSAEIVVSRGDGGRTEFRRQPPRVLLLAPEAAEPVTGSWHEARPLPHPVPLAPALAPPQRIEDLGELPVDPGTVALAEAERVLGGGLGVGDWTAFHDLARALGATVGCSRPVCDAGTLPRHRQVGASGTLISARLYLALGISGAPQHLQGIEACDHVVAVNSDPHAPIMKRADLAVVADVDEVMPALARLLDAQRTRACPAAVPAGTAAEEAPAAGVSPAEDRRWDGITPVPAMLS